MFGRLFTTLALITVMTFSAIAQGDDPVLFTVGETPINVSEFKYIYAKTNADKANFSEKSLQEYLDLYVNFKLKVERAKELRLDTIPKLQRELAGYRSQLSNTYLLDKAILEDLVKEAYDRSQKDINISHIYIKVDKEQDEKTALAKINKAKARLDKGEDFKKVVKEVSDDTGTKDTGGNLGFLTALKYPGFYDLETAAYNTKEGEYSDPIRTPIGYQIVMVNEIREARGKINAAHILIRATKPEDAAKAKTRIDEIYKELQGGADFGALAKKFSEDKTTSIKGGNLGTFGIEQYEASFENAAFGLAKDGDYSKPVQSQLGWHIVKRLSKPKMPSYDKARLRLQGQVKNDSRYKIAQGALVERIKVDAKFEENKKVKNALMSKLDRDFLTYKWRGEKATKDVLFTLAGKETSLTEFVRFLERSSSQRVRQGRNSSVEQVANDLYNSFVSDKCMTYEKTQLEKKYPEFKSLMREYEEGILLFEATKRLVWDKAVQDSVGLTQYYNEHSGKYLSEEEATVISYTCNGNEKLCQKVYKKAKKKSADKLFAKFNKKSKVLVQKEVKIEKGKDESIDNMWKERSMTALVMQQNQVYTFKKVEKITPQRPKTLSEARGYVVADYQDFLEKQWIKELESNYKVVINQKVFDSLVK